jgi:hypothetical protein
MKCPLCEKGYPKVYQLPVKLEDGSLGWLSVSEKKMKEIKNEANSRN